MGRHRGYWWAPDGRHLLVARADTSMVQRWYITDPSRPAQPRPPSATPAPAPTNAEVSLWIAAMREAGSTLTPVDWDNKTHEYRHLRRLGRRSGLTRPVQTQGPARVLRYWASTRTTGATRILAAQHDDAWVTLVPFMVTLVPGLPARTAAGVLLTSGDSGRHPPPAGRRQSR